MFKPRSRGSSIWRCGIPLWRMSPAAPPTDPPISRSSARPAPGVFAATALAQAGPLLVVTATGREADDLTAELRGVLGDAVAMFPSWETLPHERLSPGVDTVGARMMLLRRLAHPDDERLGPPLRVVVTTTRSLLQPMAPDVADIEPVTLTRRSPRRRHSTPSSRGWSSWPTPASTWSASAASSRCAAASSTSSRRRPSTRCASSSGATRSPRCGCSPSPTSAPSPRSPSIRWSRCRAASCCSPTTFATGPPSWPPSTRCRRTACRAACRDMLAKLAEGIPVDGMEALLPLLRPDELSTLSDHLPAGTPLLICDPEKVRTRAADLIKTGREFLEASWSTAAVGGDAPIDIEALGASGFVELDDARSAARDGGHPWWTLSQLSDESAVELDIRPAPSARGSAVATSTRSSRCCAPTSRPAATQPSSPPAPAPRTASSSNSPNPTRPQRCWSPASAPKEGVVGVLKGPLHDGVVIAGRQPRRDHRDRPDRQPGRRHRGQAAGRQAPQRRRPAGADRRRPGGARPARHRPVRRDDRADGRRRAPRVPGARVRVEPSAAADPTGSTCRWTRWTSCPATSAARRRR